MPGIEVLGRLDTSADGLAASEAARRLQEVGANRLPQDAGRGPLRRLLSQFNNLLIHVLLASAMLSLIMGHPVDAAVIALVVAINAAIGFAQEGRAERALASISAMIDPQASVRREGHRRTVPAADIVPGDIVLLEPGDRVPADLRLTRSSNLRIDEAALTGESVPAEKGTDPAPEAAMLADRTSMVFSGTFVAAGQGAGVAVATGGQTELGHISTLVGSVGTLQTPLLRQMERFGRRLTLIILLVAGLAFLVAYFLRGYTAEDAMLTVVSLAVAAIPEGLPAIMTVTLAIGVQRMARRHAIVRRLPAVETLGSVSVICTDKTGTLTRNEMTAATLLTADRTLEVSGSGYAPSGAILGGEMPSDFVRAAILCNDAELHESAGEWRVHGDPMEGALLTLALKAGSNPSAMRAATPRQGELPFDAAHRLMATRNGDTIFIKGAPERVLALCTKEQGSAGERPLERERWHERIQEVASRGQRMLALAKMSADGLERLNIDSLEGKAVLLGVVGLIDPPREEAVRAVADCRAAGIRVVMITGDHAGTAREIARQLGLAEDPKVLSGAELDNLSPEELRQAARDVTVFARTNPEHKLRLVEALQADGLTVAMTGDGVNDAPALKRADIGIAMGRKGTEVAKEAAQIVLGDDNFASIAAAVREGRTVYDNLRKMIVWTLPTDGGEALTLVLAIAFGAVLPVTPLQILWINMVTAVALGLTLAFEPSEPGAMQRPPRSSREGLLSGAVLRRIAFVSLLMVAGAFGAFAWATARGLPVETARTMVVNTIVAMEIFHLFSVRYAHGPSVTLRGVIGTPAVLIGVFGVAAAQFLLTYWPPLSSLFDTRPLGFFEGVIVVGIGVTLLLVTEAEKWLTRHLSRPARELVGSG